MYRNIFFSFQKSILFLNIKLNTTAQQTTLHKVKCAKIRFFKCFLEKSILLTQTSTNNLPAMQKKVNFSPLTSTLISTRSPSSTSMSCNSLVKIGGSRKSSDPKNQKYPCAEFFQTVLDNLQL